MDDAKPMGDYATDLAKELRKLPSAIGALEDFCNARRGLQGAAVLNNALTFEGVLAVRGGAEMLGELLIICAAARDNEDDQGDEHEQ
jgi:hypothetical protein